MKQWLKLASAAALVAATPAWAAPEDFAEVIDSELRLDENKALDEARQPATILDFVDFEEGDTVADFLSGNAYFAEMIAEVVGRDGRVYALNPPGFHDAEKWAELMKRRSNLRPLVAATTHQQLAPASMDVIFTHMTFHDLFWESEQFNFPRLDVPTVLANWRAALKPGGEVIIVDHMGPEGDTREVVEQFHRIDRAAAIATMEEAGFALVEQSEALLNETDDLEKSVFDPAVRGKTSRFMLKFRKK
ncbi:methyltransferase domain-containing protein [Altererythrobacter lutimaris]|uniref:Class I SAM-dependent methyltransferase n=1 Tax=Altererythrobacter lutimaris TaxID=2743979 RepID=A0A850HBY9_9SPHN|nr:methyltransferase domain-containing protein [Altererythrobacter lutimaris]NVE95060.1 class I SAM-dependent methyltransferase [Altererythrobacter lutimaris]